MSIVQILLMVLGAVMFILSFVIPERKNRLSNDDRRLTERQIREIIEKEMQDFHGKVSDIVDETISYAVEKAERSMEKLTNEKIMAVSEYSDTVLEDIHKNHEEVVFLYDMLNDKHKDLTSVATQVERTAREVKNVVTASDYAVSDAAQAAQQAASAPREFVPFTPFNPQVVDIRSEGQSILQNPTDVGLYNQAGEEVHPVQPQAGSVPVEGSEEESPAPKKRGRKPKNKDVVEKYGEKEVRIPEFPVVERPTVALSFQGGQDDNKNNNQRILELHKEGKSNVAIARELGLGVGEVKLVIDLFK